MGVSRSNGYDIGLQRQGCGVQVPPVDSFSRPKEEEEAEKQNASANLTTRREREHGLMDVNWKLDMWRHLTIFSQYM